jgi:hypothetical protein
MFLSLDIWRHAARKTLRPLATEQQSRSFAFTMSGSKRAAERGATVELTRSNLDLEAPEVVVVIVEASEREAGESGGRNRHYKCVKRIRLGWVR